MRLGIVKLSVRMSMLLFLLQQAWDCFIRLKEKSEANNDTGSKIQTESHEEKPQSVQGKSFQSEHTSDRGRWTLTPS